MSNHPYGLRGDPFAPPATLSPKDASRLIRRRVRAFNGDGGTLFPIETSDLIHELTGGVPDAILELAGRAMRVAAAEGAPAVSPSHVRAALATAPDAAEVAPVSAVDVAVAPTPPDRETERAARAIDALIEAADEAAGDVTAAVPADDVGAEEAQGMEAAPEDGDVVVARSDAGDAEVIASFEDDDDLPPFVPASIALPTRPSENLDEGEREWVSRFISGSGAGPVVGEGDPVVDASTSHEVPPGSTSPPPARRAPAGAGARPTASVRVVPAPRRKPRPQAPRKRRRSGSQGVLIAVGAVCVVAFVVRMSLRESLVPPGAAPARPTPTSAPMVEPPASPPGLADDESAPAVAPARPAPVAREPAPARTVPAPTSKSGPRTMGESRPAPTQTAPASTPPPKPGPAPVESARPAEPAVKYDGRPSHACLIARWNGDRVILDTRRHARSLGRSESGHCLDTSRPTWALV